MKQFENISERNIFQRKVKVPLLTEGLFLRQAEEWASFWISFSSRHLRPPPIASAACRTWWSCCQWWGWGGRWQGRQRWRRNSQELSQNRWLDSRLHIPPVKINTRFGEIKMTIRIAGCQIFFDIGCCTSVRLQRSLLWANVAWDCLSQVNFISRSIGHV